MSNETIALLHKHRSIRKYEPTPIPEDHIRKAVAAGQAASTSSGVQSYCILHITDPQKREALIELTGGQSKVARAGSFFVIAGDTRRHRLACQRDGRPYDASLEAFLLAVIDATLFAQNLVIAFESLEYGICYIGGLRNNLPAIDELLDIPEGVYPLYGLCAGVPAESPIARPRLPLDAVLFEDAYPDDDAMLTHLRAYDAAYRDYLQHRGGEPRDWSAIMSNKFAQPERTDLAAYYASKGARLD